jgi:hypothetical protein
MKEETEALLEASGWVGVRVNAKKTKYVYMVVSPPECRTKS